MGMPGAESWAEAWEVVAPPLMRVLQAGEAFVAEDQLIPIIRGELLEDAWWTYTYSPVFDEGEIAGSLTIVTETTNAVLTHRELARQLTETAISQCAAETASRAKDEFLATLSHELRTPLMAILGWAKMLQQDSEPARLARGLSVIERNARAQATLLDDILDVSRIVLGKLSLRTKQIDLVAVVVGASEALRPSAAAKGLEFGVVSPDGELWWVGDPDRIQQILWNLISNAIKFTPPGGSIGVRLWRDGEDVRIRVTDTGCGISPDFLPSVFDTFRQADATTSRAEGGLGLGLSIVRRLTELHGGTVAASSPGEGQGASIDVRLPAGGLASTRASRPSLVPAPRVLRQGTPILVVDDNADVRDLISAVLSRAGARVSVAASALEALEAIARFEFAALVSDLGMPEFDGFSLIRSVRALEDPARKTLPAVALTAYVDAVHRERAVSAGFDCYMTKPVDPNALIAELASLLARRPA